MAEQDYFSFSVKSDVEVEKSSMDRACKTLDDFYNKYSNKKMKINTADMVKSVQHGMNQVQKLYKQGMDEMEKGNISWWQVEDGLEAQLTGARGAIQEFFKDVKLAFSDGSIFSALDDNLESVLSEKFAQGLSVVAAASEERLKYIKEHIQDTLEQLNSTKDISEWQGKKWYGGVQSNMNERELEKHISLLRELLSCQQELEAFNGQQFKGAEAPLQNTTNNVEYGIKQLEKFLNEMKNYNSQVEEEYQLTTELFKKRQRILSELDNDSWNDQSQITAKGSADNKAALQDNIDNLEWYISEKKEAINQIKDLQDALFRVDDVSEIIKKGEEDISKYTSWLDELKKIQSGGDSPVGGDFSGIINKLEEIRKAIAGITDAFKPLTDAFEDGGSAIHKIITSSIEELEALGNKFNEVYQMVGTISNKQFNVTNVISNGNSTQNELDQIREFRKEAKSVFKEVQELYEESFATTNKIKTTPDGFSAFLDFTNTMGDFDLADLAKRIKSRSATSLGVVIDELNEWKKVLLQFNSLRNNVEAGSFNVSKYSDTSAKVKIGSKTTDTDNAAIVDEKSVDDDDILKKVKALSEQIETELTSIRAKMKETFDFSTLDLNADGITSTIEKIYQQFVDLQSKINALDLQLNIPAVVAQVDEQDGKKTVVQTTDGDTTSKSTQAINDEAKAMRNVASDGIDAAAAKEKFANANKKVAKIAEETSEKVKKEADAMEDAAGAIVEASDKFDKIKYITDADGNPVSKTTTSATTREKAIETESKYYTYDEDGDPQLQAVQIVKDFKKRATELKKEADKIALAKKTVDKFISQFESKTAGQASAIKGFDGENGLKGFEIKSLDDIEKATQKMIDLDNEYNKITKSFRQGTKSMNPFVNAITGIDEMENKILEAEIAFNGLNNQPDKLNNEIAELTPLLAKMKSYIAEDENGNKTILDIYGLAEAYGALNSALRQVNSNIKIQRKYEQMDSKDTNFALDLEKQLSGLVKQQAQWEKNGQLTNELRVNIEQMFDSLLEVTNSAELTAWKKQWSIVKDEVMATKYEIEAAKKAEGAVAKKEAEDKAYWDAEFQRSIKEMTDNKKRPELEQIKAYMLQQAVATKENVVEQYDAIMTIINSKNHALEQLMSAKGSTEQEYWSKQYSAWFGAWRDLDSEAVSEFFADTGNQAILGAKNISAYNDAVEKSKVLAARQTDAQTKQDNANLEKAIKLQEELYELKKKQASKDAGSAEGQKLARQIKAKEEEYEATKKLLKTKEQEIKLQEKQQQLQKELETAQKQSQSSYGKSIFNAESKQFDKIEAQERATVLDLELSADFTKKLNEYKEAFAELKRLRNEFVTNPAAAGNTALEKEFADAALKVQDLRTEVQSTFKEIQKLQQLSADGSLIGSRTFDPSDLENAKAAMIEYGAEISNGKLKFEGFNAACTEMYGTIDQGNGTVQKVTVAMMQGTNALYAYRDGTKQVSNSWQKLGSSLTSGITRLVTMYGSFYDIIRYVRKGLDYVKEIDLAMTELKKVTDETDETYKKFLTTASETSAVIGSTVSDFTDATAAFARLGYSITESTKMAETAIVYKNVADGLDSVEESTDSIISTMMAYGIAADDTMGIIDRFNAVGNNFAITSAGIGDAMQRSASALYAGGNSIDESIGLITAANSVIQDPMQVGTALKTLTLRLRGAKVELEEAGLDAEDMVETTAQLQAKLKALTHGKVDIMIDEDTFKNTTQILREMSYAWQDMTDIERASALELMGGKRQANILSSLITNFETVEDVIETSMNSSGSALAENEKWLDSIEGKTYQFTNALETMWSNMVDSEMVKSFIDFGTDIIQFLDTVPGKITAIVAAIAGIAKFKGLNLFTLGPEMIKSFNSIGNSQTALNALKQNFSLDNASTAEAQQYLAAYGAAVSSLTPKMQANMLAMNGLNEAQIKYAMNCNGIKDDIIEEATAHITSKNAKDQSRLSGDALIQSKLSEAATNLQLSRSEDEVAAGKWLEAEATKHATKEALIHAIVTDTKLTPAAKAAALAQVELAYSNNQLGNSFKTLMKMNPAMVIMAIGTAAMSVINWISNLTDKTEELKEAYDSLQNSISSTKSEIDSIDAELSTMQDQINELTGKKLSLSEAEELQRLQAQSDELEKQKELQESILKAREKQNEAKSLTMLNNLFETTNANQEKSVENWKKTGKVIGSVVALLASVGLSLADGPVPAGDAVGASMATKALATIKSVLKGLKDVKKVAKAVTTATLVTSQGGAIGEGAFGLIGGGVNKAMVGDSLIEWYESYEEAIAKAEQQAFEAESKYLSDVSDKNYETWQKKVEAVNTLQEEMYNGLEEMQGYINNLEYNEQTAAIIDGYKDLMTHLDVKADGDNINSQISSIELLKSEYESLSKGVDANGKNVALSAEEYARYCSIVEQVLGYTPNLIQSYNDEGEAIFNRNSLIQDSIDLLHEQQRLAAIGLVNDDVILSTFKNSKDEYKKQNKIKLENNVSGDFKAGLETLVGKEYSSVQTDEKYILENIDVIRQKWSEVIALARETNGEEFAESFRDNLQDIFTQLNYAEGAMSQFKQSLLIVPQTSEYYNELSGEHLNFINSYINTFDNLSELTDDEVLQVRNSIFALTEILGNNEIAQGLVESLFKVDSSLPVKVYVESINDILSQMVSHGFIDEKTKTKLFEQFVPDAENIDAMLEAIGGKLSDGLGKLQDMNLADLKIAYRIVADADPSSISFAELQAKIDEYSNKSVTISVPTLSSLIETTESLNEISNQTAEITINNTKVTQDYKDALIDLVGSEEKVNEYFDENNSLIVKDAKGLNKLVQTTKKNTASTAALAKTQARLQYAEMYQELKSLANGQQATNTARLQEIVAMYHEMNALEKTIMRYSVLEEQLLGAANAYEKFARAQEIDAQTDYIASAEEMVLALGQAFNTAELGTETAQTAIAGLVPESVYKDLDTVDEKMAAIHKYFKEGKIAQYFDLEFDDDGAITGVEMKLGNLRKFIEDGLAGGVFKGTDWMHFDLSEDITNLEDFAKQMGVTEEVAFAFLETLEDHDIEWLNGDYTSLLEKLLPENLENDIYENISALADLEMQLATGEISAEEYATAYSKLISEEATLADRAREEAAAWYDKTTQLEQYKNQLQEYYQQLETGTDGDGNVIDTAQVQQNIEEVTGKIDTLQSELLELEEPTELTLQVAMEDIQEELDTLEKTLEEKGIDVTAHLKWDNENSEWTVDEDSELKGNKEVQQYVELKNDQVNLESLLDDGIVSTDEHLSDIKEITQDIRALLGGEAQDSGQTTETSSDAVPSASQSTEEDSSGTLDDFKLKAQELFNTTLPTAWDEFWGNVDTFFDGLGEQANALKESLGTFFTETVPEKWNEFWDGVGEFFAEVAAKADILRENITAFFTETLPTKWDEFWDSADKFFTESVPYAIGYAAGAVVRFFTETLPQKWDEFWIKAGEAWDGIQEWAASAKDAVVTFFTQTIPNAWSNFWTNVGTYIDETLIPALQAAGDAIKSFFTETIPAKWSEFWTGVGNYITETLIPALKTTKDKVVEFFTQTIPEKWSEFWSSVGTFLTETVPQALENVKEGVTTFFTQTIPNAINSLWTSISSWISEKASTFWSNLKAGFTAGRDGGNSESGTAGANGTAHAKGTVRTGKAYKSGDFGLPQNEHDALVGEIAPEMVVDPNTGRYYTVGDNGAEMVDLPKGAIIFNHKQTEGLLKNGHISSRGKAYAEGNAHLTIYPNGSSKDQWEGTGYSSWDDPTWDAAEALKDAASDLSDAADSVSDDFRETFDWIEVRLEEIDEKLGLKQAQLENAVGAKAQNAIIDDMIDINQQLYNTLTASATKYYAHAQTLLGKIPAAYQKAAQDGSIAITEFAGEAGEEAMNAIQEYRDWVQKGADATQQAEEVITEIRSLAKQAFDNISDQYDRKNSLPESRIAKLEAAMGLAEEQGKPGTAAYYNALKTNTNTLIEQKEKERAELQADLDKKVKLGPGKEGGIKKYSPEWYEMVNDILAVDEEILDLKTDVESYDNAIQELHWEAFDENIERLQNISEETQSLIDLLSETDLFDENGVWTDEGITTIGLYGQQMENAKLQASKYAKEIAYLKKQYDAGKISEGEYADQLAELKKGQQDAIKEYNNATDAIYDLQKARVDEIKNGIDKEIEAYEELIKKKKEALSSEQDLYSFRKSISEKNKDIAEIERKLAALAGDQSMAAQAKRARLEADLAEAKAEREEMYYERSVENQQEAYDKSLENFTAEKEVEKEEWDKQLEDTKQMVADAFDDLAQKAGVVHDTLTGLAAEYGITLSDAILTPWENGENAMDTYWSSFTTTGSDAITALKAELQSFQDALNAAKQDAKDTINGLKTENQQTIAATNPTKTTTQTNGGKNNGTNQTKAAPSVGSSVTVKTSATHFSAQSGNKKMASFVPGGQYTVYETMGSGNNTQVLIGKNGVYTGWVKLTDLKGYASGTTGVTKDQLAWIDELGLEELVMHADANGRLAYLTKGSSVIPHDLTENLMSWGTLDPTNMLEQNRPSIGVSPEVHNTEINLDCSVGKLIHIEHCDQGTLPDVEKMVNKAFEKHMQNLNNSIKKFVR